MARRRRKLNITGRTLDNIEAEAGAFALLNPKERKKIRVDVMRFACEQWAKQYIPRFFTNYVRRQRGYRLKGGKDRQPFVQDGDARDQVLRGTTITVTGTADRVRGKVSMPWPDYVMRNRRFGRQYRRVIDQIPPNEIDFIVKVFEKRFKQLINENKKPSATTGRQRVLLRQRGK